MPRHDQLVLKQAKKEPSGCHCQKYKIQVIIKDTLISSLNMQLEFCASYYVTVSMIAKKIDKES